MTVVRVVPIMRLRRATAWWSYTVPTATPCLTGCLVEIPFRGATCLGIVWGEESNPPPKKLSLLSRILHAQPLIRAPEREFVEWLAEYGLCSLSTALYTVLPASLRGKRLTKPATAILAKYDTPLSTADLAARKQHAVLNPSQRSGANTALAEKYGSRFTLLEHATSDNAGLTTWLRVASGEYQIGVGREQAIFAPWLNLRHVTVIEPEDISYYHEQIPYIPMLEAAAKLANLHRSQYTLRSMIPQGAAQFLWGESAVGVTCRAQVEITDLHHCPLLNDDLIAAIRAVLTDDATVVILYNAHDRVHAEEGGERIIIPGIETLRKKLAHLLGYAELPSNLVFGTRAIFKEQYRRVKLGVILSLDPLLNQENLADQIHGWGDIGRLTNMAERCIIQAHQMDHPLIQALRNARFETYCLTELNTAKAQGHPPFVERVVCTVPDTAMEMIPPVLSGIRERLSGSWRLSESFQTNRRTSVVQNILLIAPTGSRLPAPLVAYLSALPRPWKVQRNPWYAF